MPSTSQIVPEHDYAHSMVVVHDNSARPTDDISAAETTFCNMMFVFSSPKGIDRELQTVDRGLKDFVERYGVGCFDDHGQPFLNAYAAASTNAATLHCLRVTADDATYAVGALVAHYKATPGSSAVEPEPVPSDKVNVMGHENVLVTDTVDEVTGDVIITIAGVDVEPGISAENAELFGPVSSECVDITIDLTKIVTLEDAKTYQVTQINPALVEYIGKDEFVSEVNGSFQKVKTYTGAILKEGYSLLIGAQTAASLSIVEWGAIEPAKVVINATDLGIVLADSKGAMNVTAAQVGGVNTFNIACTGEVVAGVINANLWGAISGNQVELDLIFPGVDISKRYHVIQKNMNLAQYANDPSIVEGPSGWQKSKDYVGAEINDGYGLLLGEGIDAQVDLYLADGFVDEDQSDPIARVVISNEYTFVAAHPQEPVAGPVGEAVDVVIDAALSFTTTVAKSSLLRATAKANAVKRAITPAAETAVPGRMDVFYTFKSIEGVSDLENLGSLVPVDSTPDADGYVAAKLFEISCRGRGAWGNNVRFTLESFARGDRLSAFKNYILSVYEIDKATMLKKEEFTVAFNPDAVDADGKALYVDYIVGDPYDSSKYVNVVANPRAFVEMFAEYVKVFPDTSLNAQTFDPITGLMHGTSLTPIEGLHVDTTSNGVISVTGASGIALVNGSDGSFAANHPNRAAAMADAYLKAYSGEIDRNVRSRKMFPTDLILDANFPVETKIAIHELVTERKDCVGIFDVGIEMNTYAAVLENLADIEPYVITRSEAIDCYRGKIQDPVSFKIVPVTSTYALAQMYPRHFQQHGDKHVPLAGSAYGVMSGFISGSAWPVYDDDLDQKILDELTENKVNFLKVNTKKQVVRGAQNTRQDADTNLSELSNVFILNDIRRDAVQMCEQYEYNFAEASDLQRFNKAAAILAEKYQSSQVASISAEFKMNDWESQRGILHLYVEFVHKKIIKRSIIEIDVNRGRVVV